MKTRPDIVHRHARTNFCVHRIDDRARCAPSCDIGLIGDDDDQKSCLLKFPYRGFDAGKNAKVTERRWSNEFAVALYIRIGDAIAVEKNCSYHLVAFFWSL